MLGLRIIAAAVLAAIILPTLIWGGTKGIAILVATFALVAVWELTSKLSGLKGLFPKSLLMALTLTILLLFYAVPVTAVSSVVVFCPLLILAIHLFSYNLIENTVESVSQMIFVCAYVTIPLAHAILIGRADAGYLWIIFTLVVVCLGDAGAYFGGKYFGRRRLSAHVSPSKTVEGLIGGFVGNLAGMIVMKVIVPSFPPIGVLLKLTILLALAAPVGDLCASALKRRLEIKDFGSIIPGHGGVLDRADSLIPSIPIVFYFMIFSGYGIF
jgi:phosphatidate cytidylyltransferase